MARWIKCPFCGHKLFKAFEEWIGHIEIKCPSCKRIFEIEETGGCEN